MMAAADLKGEYRLQPSTYGRSELVSAYSSLEARLSRFVTEHLAQVSWGQASVVVTTNDEMGPSDREELDAVLDEAREDTHVPIRERVSKDQLQLTPQTYCYYPFCDTLIGGAKYMKTSNPASTTCTLGFAAVITSPFQSLRVMLTADHCVTAMAAGTPPGSAAYVYSQRPPLMGGVAPPAQVIGSVGHGQYGSNGDWGYIVAADPPPAGWDPGLGRPYSGFHDWQFATDHPLPFQSWGTAPQGTVVCKNAAGSGSYPSLSGTQCGTVYLQGSNDDGTGVHVTTTSVQNMIGCAGDSGAEVHSQQDVAIGIHSGGSGQVVVAPNQCFSTSNYTPIDRMQTGFTALGWNFSMPTGP